MSVLMSTHLDEHSIAPLTSQTGEKSACALGSEPDSVCLTAPSKGAAAADACLDGMRLRVARPWILQDTRKII